MILLRVPGLVVLEEEEEDKIEIFKQLVVKLKKKNLIRKPNYGEAIGTLTEISNYLKRHDRNNKYAAFCLLAVGKCEQILKYKVQTMSYIDAGSIFFNAAIEKHLSFLCQNDFKDEMHNAVQCVLYATRTCVSQHRNSLCATLLHEMGILLMHMEEYHFACMLLQEASDIYQNESNIKAILALQCGIDCYIRIRDYRTCSSSLVLILKLISELNDTQLQDWQLASISVGEAVHSSQSVFRDMLFESKVSLIFTLSLQGDFQQSHDFIQSINSEIKELEVSNHGVLVQTLHDIIDSVCFRDLEGFSLLRHSIGDFMPLSATHLLLFSEVERQLINQDQILTA